MAERRARAEAFLGVEKVVRGFVSLENGEERAYDKPP